MPRWCRTAFAWLTLSKAAAYSWQCCRVTLKKLKLWVHCSMPGQAAVCRQVPAANGLVGLLELAVGVDLHQCGVASCPDALFSRADTYS